MEKLPLRPSFLILERTQTSILSCFLGLKGLRKFFQALLLDASPIFLDEDGFPRQEKSTGRCSPGLECFANRLFGMHLGFFFCLSLKSNELILRPTKQVCNILIMANGKSCNTTVRTTIKHSECTSWEILTEKWKVKHNFAREHSPSTGDVKFGLQIYVLEYAKPENSNNVTTAFHLDTVTVSFLFTGEKNRRLHQPCGCPYLDFGIWRKHDYDEWVDRENIRALLRPIKLRKNGIF